MHGGNLSSWLHTLQVNHPADFERISKWVREAFPEIESLGTVVTQAGTTFLSSREKFLQSPITVFEASAGQLKFIALTSLIYSPFGVPMTCLEEPANHLHPRLLSLLVEMANQRRMELHGNVSQTIATTHSPYPSISLTRGHRTCLQAGRRDEVPSSRIRRRTAQADPRVREYTWSSLVQWFTRGCITGAIWVDR
jgi:predicted ATPase